MCIGLDTDIAKIPPYLLEHPDPIYEFNKAIIDATHDLCVAYKPNIAFYEALGVSGWLSLEKTMSDIPDGVFTIADAKRGDIGNTSSKYAHAFFDVMDFDSITLSPYMGKDSISPYLEYPDKWVIILALTSNPGAMDFQFMHGSEDNQRLFEKVLQRSQEWGTPDNMMYVVGATQASMIGDIRKVVPDHFFLVPGVGAQGGDLNEVAKYGLNDHCGLLVNSSRSIIYASGKEDFAEAARAEALKLQKDMERILGEAGLI